MVKAAEYSHNKGMHFGFYRNKSEEMARPEGRQDVINIVKATRMPLARRSGRNIWIEEFTWFRWSF